jgi:hypothetical protein
VTGIVMSLALSKVESCYSSTRWNSASSVRFSLLVYTNSGSVVPHTLFKSMVDYMFTRRERM